MSNSGWSFRRCPLLISIIIGISIGIIMRMIVDVRIINISTIRFIYICIMNDINNIFMFTILVLPLSNHLHVVDIINVAAIVPGALPWRGSAPPWFSIQKKIPMGLAYNFF